MNDQLDVIPTEREIDAADLEQQPAAQPEDQVVEDEEQSATPETAEAEDQPKKRSRRDKRIDALTLERENAQREANELRRQLDEFNRQQQEQALQNAGGEVPTLEQYGYDEAAFQKAQADWRANVVKQIEEDRQKADAERQAREQYTRQLQSFEEARLTGREKHADWDSKINTAPPMAQMAPATMAAVLDSESKADLLYYYASNPLEVHRIAQLEQTNPVLAGMELGKLTQTFAPKKAPPRQPPPPSGDDFRSDVADPGNQNMPGDAEQYREWRLRQMEAKSRR